MRAVVSNGEFGRRIGVSHSMASRIRTGRRLPSIRTLNAIHQEFDIPLEELHRAYTTGRAAFSNLIQSALDHDRLAA